MKKQKRATNSKPSPKDVVIPCFLASETRDALSKYIADLKNSAHTLGGHGLSKSEFWASGLFHAAIERIRGSRAASMKEKHIFVSSVLDRLKKKRLIGKWRFTGSSDRHDYTIDMPSGRVAVVETKGCLDGNNTNIFQRPANADEFVIWSLCQNAGADPRHNVWSGIHTRLGADIIHRGERVDALVVWDMLCGSAGRPCPKLTWKPAKRGWRAGKRTIPPPCIFLFPRSRPHPRDNPMAEPWQPGDLAFVQALQTGSNSDARDITSVRIETRMDGVQLQRRTILLRGGDIAAMSRWTTLKRART